MSAATGSSVLSYLLQISATVHPEATVPFRISDVERREAGGIISNKACLLLLPQID
jgi:hypothetical protein